MQLPSSFRPSGAPRPGVHPARHTRLGRTAQASRTPRPSVVPLRSTWGGVRSPWALTVLAVACAMVLTAVGCASVPMPTAEMAVAEAAVQRADNPATRLAAPEPLRAATAKLALARQAVAAGDGDTARRLAEQARVDALVADGQAQAVRARQSAQASQDALQALREELNRKTVR